MLGTWSLETQVEGGPGYSRRMAERVLDSSAAPSRVRNSQRQRLDWLVKNGKGSRPVSTTAGPL